MGSTKSITANIKTNLKKKRKQKVSQMSDFSITDFIIKNKNLLGKVKVCRVKLTKIPKNKLIMQKISKIHKKNGNEKRVHKIKDTKSKSTLNIKKNSKPKKAGLALNAKEVSNKNKIKNAKNSPAPNTEPAKASPNQSKVISPSRKTSDGKSKRQIYIRLPLLDNVTKLQKISELPNAHKGDFKNEPVDKLSKTYLTQKFGKKFFQCHVKVIKLNDPKDPTLKKFKHNRKNVSFVETIEVLGDESNNSDTNVDMIGKNVDSLNKEPLNGNTGSPNYKTKKSTLRKSVEEDESSKRKLLRKSDEEIPLSELGKRTIEEDIADNNTEECILPDNPPLLFVGNNEECVTEVARSHVNNIAQSVTLENEEKNENIQKDAPNESNEANSNVKKNNYEEIDSVKSCSLINESKDMASTTGLSSAAKRDEKEDFNDEYNDDDIYMASDKNKEMEVTIHKELQDIRSEKLSDEFTAQPNDSSEEVMKDVTDMSQSSLQTKSSLSMLFDKLKAKVI